MGPESHGSEGGTATTVAGKPRRRRGFTDRVGLAPGATVGRYEIRGRIGYGGMGVVYEAHDPTLNRSVAIKLVTFDVGDGRDETRARYHERLIREAHTLARLAHPNIVGVYDAGAFGDSVFMAMPLLQGDNLRDWLGAEQRDWREILAVFLQAGAGLAAAHDAGIVHRDFKPSNVHVDHSGRVRVIDFGLARAAQVDGEVGDSSDSSSAMWSDSSDSGVTTATEPTEPLGAPLTAVGAVMGTPKYMAPEQHHGQPVDHQGDQFSFCVALWEALFSERPYAGKTRAQLQQSFEEGTVRQPRAGHGVPRRIRRALEHGLAVEPDDRYPSMHQLLAVLRRRPLRTIGRWAPAVAVGGVAVAVALLGGKKSVEPCTGGEARLATVWNSDARDALKRAFLAVDRPFADRAQHTVIGRLDGYGKRWIEMHRQSCRATRVNGEQSEAMLDLRMACLSHELEELGAQIKVFENADETVVRQSVNAVLDLAPVADCADIDALLSHTKLPTDPATLEEAARVRSLAASARALTRSGLVTKGAERAREAAEASTGLAYPEVVAYALTTNARALHRAGKFEAAAAEFRQAARAAETAGDDKKVLEAGTGYVYALAEGLQRYDDAFAWAKDLEAKLTRLDHPPRATAYLDRVVGAALMRKGRYPEALARLEAARALLDTGDEQAYPELYQVENYLAITLWYQGKLDQAADYFDRALVIALQLYGPDHPITAIVLGNRGHVSSEHGKSEEALGYYQRSLKILRGAYGDDHPNVARMLNNVADSYRELGEQQKALELYHRAIEIWEHRQPPDQSELATLHHNLGWLHLEMGELEKAAAQFDRAVELRLQVLGPDHPFLAEDHVGAGNVALARGQLSRARSELELALAVCDRAKVDSCSARSKAVLGLGRLELARHRPRAALPHLRQAVSERDNDSVNPIERADAELWLARGLWAAGSEPDRAHALAASAMDRYRAAGRPGRKGLAEARAILAEHP